MPNSPRPRLALILSSERSGSTLLRTLIGNHSHVVAPTEMWLLHFSTYGEWRAAKPIAMNSVIDYLREVGRPYTVAELDQRCCSWSTLRVYQWLLEMLPEGHILVDKTPGYTKSMATLRRSLKFQCSYIWLMRHPLGVVDSHLRLRRKQAKKREKNWKGSLWYHANQWVPPLRKRRMKKRMAGREALWCKQNKNVRRFFQQSESSRHMRVSFEEMVRQPDEAITSVCNFLHLERESQMADVSGKGDVPANLGDPTFGRFNSVSEKPADRWKKRFSIGDLSRKTKQLMKELKMNQDGGFEQVRKLKPVL